MDDEHDYTPEGDELHPQIHMRGGTVFLNPGTGPVRDATEQHAMRNIERFIMDIGIALVDWQRESQMDSDGRFGFTLFYDLHHVEIEMPGCELSGVRYIEAEGQNVWRFPRLYVDGSSWIWSIAVDIARGVLNGENDEV